MLTLGKLATPPPAVTAVVPVSAPPPAFVPIATVTLPANAVAVLLLASSAVTTTAGVIAAPATVVVGCVVNTSWLAGPSVMVNAALVAVGNPPPGAVTAPPAPPLPTPHRPNC